MKIDTQDMDIRECQKLVTNIILPRPIAFVSTVGKDNINNLAAFSFFGGICPKPPTIYVSIVRRRDGSKKDTINNIEFSRDFVVNVVDEKTVEPMNLTAPAFPSDVDEFKEAGLTAVASDIVKSPRVAEAPISIECRLIKIEEFGTELLASVVFGEIVLIHVRDELYQDGMIDAAKLGVVGRLGGELYSRTRDIFELVRPAEHE